MSVRMINWAFAQKICSPSAKFVLVTLADYANDEGECWPSFGKIELKTELSRATIIRSISLLKQKGLITVFHRVRSHSHVSNLYQLKYERAAYSESAQAGSSTARPAVELVAQTDQGSTTERPAGVAQNDQCSSTEKPGVVAQSNPNRYIEPSAEPSNQPSQEAFVNSLSQCQTEILEDVVQHAQAKQFFATLSYDVFNRVLHDPWPADLTEYLDQVLPARIADLALIDWFYRLSDDHEIFRHTMRRQSLRTLLQHYESECDKIRVNRKKIGMPTEVNGQPDYEKEQTPEEKRGPSPDEWTQERYNVCCTVLKIKEIPQTKMPPLFSEMPEWVKEEALALIARRNSTN
jgi:hypothetical protein